MKIINTILLATLIYSVECNATTTTSESINVSLSPNLYITTSAGNDYVQGQNQEYFSIEFDGYSGPGQLTSVEYEWSAYSTISYTHSPNNSLPYRPGQYNEYYVEQSINFTAPFTHNEIPWGARESRHLSSEPEGILLQPIFWSSGTLTNLEEFTSPWLLEGNIFSNGSIRTATNSGFAEVLYGAMSYSMTITYHAEDPIPVPVPVPAVFWLFNGTLILLFACLTKQSRK